MHDTEMGCRLLTHFISYPIKMLGEGVGKIAVLFVSETHGVECLIN